jgi:hypothetical protein
MSIPLPSPSNRLLRAASAEQAELVRHRDRLTNERARILRELRELDEAVAGADQRLDVLAQLIGSPQSRAAGGGGSPEPEREPAPEPPHDNDSRTLLRGPAIREAAVQVLIGRPEHIEALHYRRWYELLAPAGYEVAGKDPLAVFLTQLSRSPVVRKATQPGIYELDRQAPLRIRQRLEKLQAELREVTVAPHGPIELATVRARRHELDLAISQQERALEEALRVLRRTDTDADAVAEAATPVRGLNRTG